MKTEIRDELKDVAATLASIGNANCYCVPDRYFEDFADEVVSKIQLPSTQLPYAAPAPAYFEGLAGTILSKIKSNGTIVEEDSDVSSELTALSPLVAGIKKENVYTVPADYFANFKVAIPAAAPKAKVVTLHPVHWMRYAAAAAVIGIVAIGGVFFLKYDKATSGNPLTTITADYDKPLSSVSDDAIANYLNQSPEEMDITPSSVEYDDSKINPGDLAAQLLNDVSDSDIQEYLRENEPIGEKDIKGI